MNESKKWTYKNRAEYYREYMREYQRKNKEKLVPYKRAKKYGLDVESMNEMLEQAGDKCSVCQLNFGTETTEKCIDHCHDTGKIRGIICNKCNAAVGMLNNDIDTIRRLVIYLES